MITCSVGNVCFRRKGYFFIMLPKVDYVLITPLFWCNFYRDLCGRRKRKRFGGLQAEGGVQNHLATDGSFLCACAGKECRGMEAEARMEDIWHKLMLRI